MATGSALMSTKCTVFCKALENEAELAPVIVSLDTIRLEEQGMKAASKVAVYFVSSHLGLFEEHACMGTDYIISCSPLIHSGRKTKADLWVQSGSPLTRTILAKKCPSLSFPVQETGDFGLDARQKFQQCRVRMGQGGCLCYPP